MQSTTLKVPPNQERTSGRLYEDPLGTGPGAFAPSFPATSVPLPALSA